jgi:hypothetical protein
MYHLFKFLSIYCNYASNSPMYLGLDYLICYHNVTISDPNFRADAIV